MKKNIIFWTGGAFGMIYQMGALTAISLTKSNYIFYGCSAGALNATMTLLGYTDKEMLQIYDYMSLNALESIEKRPYHYDTYNLTPKHFEVLEMINKDYPDAYRILTKKKLHIGVTHRDGFRWHKRFRSNEELFNILLCSFHVPILCSYNASIDGVPCIDGGFGFDVDKHLPPNTLVICPKHTESVRFDVLNGEVPVKFCATPPPPKERAYYYAQGYKDMKRYLKHGKTTTTNVVALDESIVPISVWWFLRDLQPDDTTNVLSKLFI